MTEPSGPIGAALRAQAEREQRAAAQLVRHSADTITDDDLDQLYARAERAERVARSAARDTAKALTDYLAAEQRAERAEAAITRVRALANFYADPKERGKLGVPHPLIAYSIRAALDEPKEPTP